MCKGVSSSLDATSTFPIIMLSLDLSKFFFVVVDDLGV
jgi:hypothetical protein